MHLEIPLSNQAVPCVALDGSRVTKAARRLAIKSFKAQLGGTRMWILRISIIDNRFK